MTEWIVTSSVLILIIAALRYLLRGRISLRLQYALWAVVLLRLLLPVQLGHSSLSVLNAVENNTWQQYTESYVDRTPDIVTPEQPSVPVLTLDAVTQPELPYDEDLAQSAASVSPSTVLRAVWITGMAVTAVWLITANLRFAKMLRRSRRLTEHRCGKLPVYVSPLVATPCLFGLFRPNLYVTEETAQDETALRHALFHEQTHYRHGDHVWSMLRGVCLALHWYNPLVWLAASLSRRDAELACDEGVLHRLGEEERTAYGETLIRLTCGHRPGELLLTATAMTGSKKSLRERIALIAKKPKMAVYTLVAAVLVVTVAAGCTFTGSTPDPEPEPISVTVSDELQHPIRYPLQQILERHIRSQAAQVGELVGDPDFVTSAEITFYYSGSSSSFGDAVKAEIADFDYRLLPKEPGKVGDEVGGMVYVEEDGRIWLKEKRSKGYLYLATEYWKSNGTDVFLGVFSEDDVAIQCQFDAYSYARMLYQSKTSSYNSYVIPISTPSSPLYSDAILLPVKDYVNVHAEVLTRSGSLLNPNSQVWVRQITRGAPANGSTPVTFTYRIYDGVFGWLSQPQFTNQFKQGWEKAASGHALPATVQGVYTYDSTPLPYTEFTATILVSTEQLSAGDLLPVTLYTDSWRNPEPVLLAAQDYIAQQAQAVNTLTGNAGFVTGGEICGMQAITTGTVSENMGINLYHLDYRLHLQGGDTLYTDLNNMSYVEEDGVLYLREDDSRGTPILAMEYCLQEGGGRTWTRLGILYTGDVETQYGGDYNRAAVEFYESVRNSVH